MHFLLPFKGIESAKSRWSDLGHRRHHLVLRILRNNVETVSSVVGPEKVFLVTPDQAKSLADLQTLLVEGRGLNLDLQQAQELLSTRSEVRELAVLLPDLPALTAEDVKSLIEALKGSPIALCPDREEFGTNALAMREAGLLDFLFEGASFSRYRQACRDRNLDYAIVRSKGLAHDCDSVKDLESFCLL